jgi:O-succinylbenzoate synthase
MISLAQILDSLTVIQLPMRTKFRGITNREVALFKTEEGWGEFSPFLEYDDNESIPWLLSGIEAVSNNQFPIHREWIDINGTIPDTDSESEIAQLIELYHGAHTFKVKVGSGLSEDLLRIARVRKFAPNAKIRIDVNGSWSIKDAISNISAIYEDVSGEYLEYIEQPVATLIELKELKETLGIPVKIAVDELLRKSNDPLKLDLTNAADILILKVAPLGGIANSLAIANHHNLPVVVSSALESAIGISHGLRLAAALPVLNYASGLATGKLFLKDVANHEIKAGKMRVNTPIIEPEQIKELQAPKERIEWWRNRIERVWELAQ